MSPNAKYLGLQALMVFLWVAGGLSLFALGLKDLLLAWMVICSAAGIASWFVRCPRCGESVYLTRLTTFVQRDGGLADCRKCGLDLTKKYNSESQG
jgi:hypothetical protein